MGISKPKTLLLQLGYWVIFFSLVLIGSVYFVSLLPAESLWQETVGDTSYQKILGSINGGIFIASLVAYLVGEFSNSAVLSKMKILTQGKMLWLRTMSSISFVFFLLDLLETHFTLQNECPRILFFFSIFFLFILIQEADVLTLI